MPGLTTTTNTNPPPQPDVDIEVENGGGAGGPKAVVVLTATWDPAKVGVVRATNPRGGFLTVNASAGYCIWHGHSIAFGQKKPFRLRLCRKAAGNTWLVASATDPALGYQSPVNRWAVPANLPPCRKKKTTKARKKA